jgi:hypothetical protein
MNAINITDSEIESYLLGTAEGGLPEAIDELTFVDEDFAARVGSVERDLVDDYLRKELDPESVKRFESFYMRSPRRREKVRLGASLGAFFAAAIPAEQHPIRAEPVAGTQERRTAVWWKFAIPAFAAAVLLAVAVPLWLNSPTRQQQANVNAETNSNQLAKVQPTAEPSPAIQPTASPNVSETPANRNAPAVNENRRVTPPASRVFALSLSPQLRGATGETRFSIPPESDTVAVTLQIEPTEFNSVRVELRERSSGRVVWQGRARPSGSGAYQTVGFSVQSKSLKPGSFNFTVSGAGSNAEIIGTYPFVIVP